MSSHAIARDTGDRRLRPGRCSLCYRVLDAPWMIASTIVVLDGARSRRRAASIRA